MSAERMCRGQAISSRQVCTKRSLGPLDGTSVSLCHTCIGVPSICQWPALLVDNHFRPASCSGVCFYRPACAGSIPIASIAGLLSTASAQQFWFGRAHTRCPAETAVSCLKGNLTVSTTICGVRPVLHYALWKLFGSEPTVLFMSSHEAHSRWCDTLFYSRITD
jgi:hypothetical protein